MIAKVENSFLLKGHFSSNPVKFTCWYRLIWDLVCLVKVESLFLIPKWRSTNKTPETGASQHLEKLCPSQRDFFILLLVYASFVVKSGLRQKSKTVSPTEHFTPVGSCWTLSGSNETGRGWAGCDCRGWGRQLSCGHRHEEPNRQPKMCQSGRVKSCLHLVIWSIYACSDLHCSAHTGLYNSTGIDILSTDKSLSGLVLSPTADVQLPSQLKNNSS